MNTHFQKTDKETPIVGKVVGLRVTRVAPDHAYIELPINDPMKRVQIEHRQIKDDADVAPALFKRSKWYTVQRVEQTSNGWSYPIVGFFLYPGDLTSYVDELILKYSLDQEKPHERI